LQQGLILCTTFCGYQQRWKPGVVPLLLAVLGHVVQRANLAVVPFRVVVPGALDLG
jgi:hypothetical protein